MNSSLSLGKLNYLFLSNNRTKTLKLNNHTTTIYNYNYQKHKQKYFNEFQTERKYFCTTTTTPIKKVKKIRIRKKKNSNRKSRDHWKDLDNQRLLFDSIGKKIGVKNTGDWSHVTLSEFKKYGGNSLITSIYKGNYRNCLRILFPDFEFDFKKEKKGSKRFTFLRSKLIKRVTPTLILSPHQTNEFPPPPSISSHHSFTNEEIKLRSKLIDFYHKKKYQSYEDWYYIGFYHIPKHIKIELITKYKKFSRAISLLFPEIPFRFYLFANCSIPVWKKLSNQKLYLDDMFYVLKLTKMEDWYSVTSSDIISLGGSSLIKIYTSFCDALIGIYKNYPWDLHKVRYLYRYDLHSRDIQLDYLQRIKNKLNIKTYEDWYNINTNDIIRAGGRKIMNKYKGSIPRMLISVYPEYNWNFFKSDCKKKVLLNNSFYFNELVNSIRKMGNVQRPADWLRISDRLIYSVYSKTLISSRRLMDHLREQYPDQFPPALFGLSSNPKSKDLRKAVQRHLFSTVSSLCKQHHIIEDYQFPSIHSAYLQFDIFLPGLNIAIEYQGEQHYHDLPSNFAFSDLYARKDAEKREYARQKKIFLFIVPYWWDRSPNSIAYILNSLKLDQYIYAYPIKKPTVRCLYTLLPLNE